MSAATAGAREEALRTARVIAEMGREALEEGALAYLILAERRVERAVATSVEWRAQFSRVAKANVLDPQRKERVKAIIARRRGIVERVEADPRMARAMVDLLRDVEAEIEEEWEW